MTLNLSNHAKSIQEILEKCKLTCKVVELPHSTRTAYDAAKTIGCSISHIVKSLIFKTSISHKPILILVSGSNQVNEEKIESLLNEKLVKAPASFVKEVTGFSIGGIPPIGHKNPIDTIYIDQDLLKLDEVWAAAGTSHAVFSISVKKLLTIVNGKTIDLSQKKG